MPQLIQKQAQEHKSPKFTKFHLWKSHVVPYNNDNEEPYEKIELGEDVVKMYVSGIKKVPRVFSLCVA